ncbi:MAG: rod shape-determining protein [Dethiobacter sp.]|nr:MAG: rod shape-determining protein [Dethiobacter sp.]
MRFLANLFAGKICIDPGTVNTSVFIKGKGIVLRQPSVVALQNNGSVLAVGDEAKKMIGRTPQNITIVRPIKNGVVANFDLTRIMFKHFFSKLFYLHAVPIPQVTVPLSLGVTDIERRALQEAIKQAGAKEVTFIEAPMAAALGANLPVDDYRGAMIVNLGGGTSEVAVISLGGIVTSSCLRFGGENMDETIIKYIRKKHYLVIGERTAEEIKITIGSSCCRAEEYMDIRGKDLISRLPGSLTISSSEIQKVLAENIAVILKNIRDTLERTPLELAFDIMKTGITLTGGGALLKGFSKAVAEATGMPAQLAEKPLDCNVLGAGKIVKDPELFKKIAVIPQEAP